MVEDKISLPMCTCSRCGHKWFLRKPENPRVCPKCKSPYWNAQSEFKQEFDLDMERALIIEKELSETIAKCTHAPQHWTEVVEIGWQRMLDTSDFPVKDVDRVFQANYPIYTWFITVHKASGALAAEVARKLGSTDEIKRSKEIDEGIRKSLDWDAVLARIDEKVAKALGFLWYADSLSTGMNFIESEAHIQEKAWSLIEKNLEMKRMQIAEHIELIVTGIDESNNGATVWGEIIRFP